MEAVESPKYSDRGAVRGQTVTDLGHSLLPSTVTEVLSGGRLSQILVTL